MVQASPAGESPLVQAEAVNRMFASIAGRYDRANHFLTFGIDRLWRSALTRAVARRRPSFVVDLATGSGDVAMALRRRLPADVPVLGLDFCPEMLDVARAKTRRWTGDLEFRTGDCLALPLEDASVDALTIAFGLRNLEDRAKGVAEMLRVLRPGGALHILEFSQPYDLLEPFYYFYLGRVLPVLASAITGNRDAYRYLGATIGEFPSRGDLSRFLGACGFDRVSSRAFTGSIVALHTAEKLS